MTDSTEQAIDFTNLLLEITASLITIPVEEIDAAIEDTQRRICTLYGLDRSVIYQFSAQEPDVFELTHVFQSGKDPFRLERATDKNVLSDWKWFLGQAEPPIYMRLNGAALFPWMTDKIKGGEPFALSNLDELPDEAAIDREMLRKFGTRSTFIVPLAAGGRPLGAISFASTQREVAWTPSLQRSLQWCGQIFSSALERNWYDQSLRTSEEHLLLAAESAEADLWILHLETGRYWVTETVRKKYGVSPGEEFTMEMFLGFVHPDDRELIHRAIQESIRSKRLCSVEYRLVLADGSIRWMVSRGRVFDNEEGKPFSLSGMTFDNSERKEMENRLMEQCREIEQLKLKIEAENYYLKDEIKTLLMHPGITGRSEPLKNVLQKVEQVAKTGTTVLICGETGTGKELIAQSIHEHSPRKNKLMVKVNCASLPSSLVESELFGRERGAYTGALTSQIGRFELADGSTIFLDEISEISLDLQAKLLRVLQEGEFERLGSPRSIKVNVRVIAATNRNLLEEVRNGRFREDLYYRLNVFPIQVPPLRERSDDIPLLVWEFIREFNDKMGKKISRISKRDIAALQAYSWPGNVRELRNVIEYAVIVSNGDELKVRTPDQGSNGTVCLTLEDVERRHIREILKRTEGRIKGEHGAAKILGMNPATLYSRMRKLSISLRSHKDEITTSG